MTRVLIIAVLFAAGFGAWRLLFSSGGAVTLPKPSGSLPVGRRIAEWHDTARNRDLVVFVWYPAATTEATESTPVLPEKWAALARRRFVPEDIRGSAPENAPVRPGRHPLLLLLPAMGGLPTDYTAIAEDLASYGYIVAGVTPTGSARVVVFRDGRAVMQTDSVDLDHREAAQPLVERWQQDGRYVEDRLLSDPAFGPSIDAGRLGVMGHSFGGAVALHVLADGGRIQRAANLDGAPEGKPITNLRRPVLYFDGADGPPAQAALDDRILREMKAICASAGTGCVWRDGREAGHMNFSDLGVIALPPAIPRSHFGLTDIDGRAFLRHVSTELRAFFDAM